MDIARFDRLTRGVAAIKTRRGAARLLAGGLVSGLLTRRATEPARAQLAGCIAPRTMCSGYCVDLATNPFHCGACFNYCQRSLLENVETVCLAGACTSVQQPWAG